MKLLESIDCKKGITLNSQLVDLLSILDEEIPEEEQDRKITEYIRKLEARQSKYREAKSKGTAERYKFVINEVIDSTPNIPFEGRDDLKRLYLLAVANFDICDTNKMKQLLQENGFDSGINDMIMKSLRNIDLEAKEGILSLTPDKVRALYSHLFKDGNTYDRVTFDNAGKYSSYVSIDGKTYAPERLEKMIQFCEKHNMKSKINTFFMYCDFPQTLEVSLDKRIAKGEITEEDKKAIIKQSLFDYAKDIGQRYGDRIETVDIFNELIYDPKMSEPGFEEEPTYHPRKQGWQKYLDLEDLCEMALMARKLMPNTVFTYNDMNWVDPEKRQEIIKIIKQIQVMETKYRNEGTMIDGINVRLGENEKLIDTIGVESHLTTGIDINEINRAFQEVEEQCGLPIEVTELDVARTGKNPLSKKEIKKQRKIFETFMKLAQKGKISTLTIWSQSDELSFMNDKCGRKVYASLLDDNFDEKEITETKQFGILSFIQKTINKIASKKLLPQKTRYSTRKNWKTRQEKLLE